jgi:adenylate kinase family enzyme
MKMLKAVACLSLLSVFAVPVKPCIPCLSASWQVLLKVGAEVAPHVIQACLNGTQPVQAISDVADDALIKFVQQTLVQLKKNSPETFKEFVDACTFGTQITPLAYQTLLAYNLINSNGSINEIVVRIVKLLTIVSQTRAGERSVSIQKIGSGCWGFCKKTLPLLSDVADDVAEGVLTACLNGTLAENPQGVVADIAEESLIKFVQGALVQLKNDNPSVFTNLVNACTLGALITPEAYKVLLQYNLINSNGSINEIVVRLVNVLIAAAETRAYGALATVKKVKEACREGKLTPVE